MSAAPTGQLQASLEFADFDNGKVRFKYPRGWKVTDWKATEQKPRYSAYLSISITPPGSTPTQLDPSVLATPYPAASGFYIAIKELGYLSTISHEEVINFLEKDYQEISGKNLTLDRITRVQVSGRLALKVVSTQHQGGRTWRNQQIIFPAYRGQREGLQVLIYDRARVDAFSESVADKVMLSLVLDEAFWELSGSGPGGVEGAP
jgi:hypothetical protein